MRLMPSVNNETCLEWLDLALKHAFESRSPELWTYLETVMEEVLFEVESQRPGDSRT